MNIFNRTVVEDTMSKFGFGKKEEPPPGLIDLDNIDFEKDPKPKSTPKALSFEPKVSKESGYKFTYNAKSEPYKELIEKMETEHELPKGMLANLIGIESNWNPKAVSDAGAGGLMQLMPGTAKMLGVKDVFDPKENVKGGVKYLKQLKKRFGTWEKAWAAYNMGPTALAKGRPYPQQTKDYVEKMKGFQEAIKDSSTIDFESDKPINFESEGPIDLREPPGIYMPKEQSTWDKFKSLITDPGLDKDRASNIIYLADTYGISPSRAEKHYDELKTLIFEGTQPTSRDVAGGLMGAGVATGLIFNPVATAIGVGTFMGLDELENYIISKYEEDPYQFQGGKGLSDLLEAHGLSKDAIDMLDFIWKMPVAGGTTKFGRGVFGKIASMLKGERAKVRFINKVVDDVAKVKYTVDEAALKNAEEFGINKDQLSDVVLVQKAAYPAIEPRPTVAAKIPDVKRFSEEPENPLEITRPTDAEPNYTFTSKRGNFYEKIGEKWYDSKGKEVTNKYIIEAAEQRKVEFGVDEEADAEVVARDIERKTGKRIEEVSDEELDKYYEARKAPIEEVRPKIERTEPTTIESKKIDTIRRGINEYYKHDEDILNKYLNEFEADITTLKGKERSDYINKIYNFLSGYLKTEPREPLFEFKMIPLSELMKGVDPSILRERKYRRRLKVVQEPTYKAAEPKPTLTPEEKEATEIFYDRRINELTEEEIELFLEDYRGKTSTEFLKDDAAVEADKLKFEEKGDDVVASNPETLTNKLINDANRWYKGDDSVDINAVRNTLEMMRDRSEDIKNAYFHPPDTAWAAWHEKNVKAAEWAKNLRRPGGGGTKLTSGVDPTDLVGPAKKAYKLAKEFGLRFLGFEEEGDFSTAWYGMLVDPKATPPETTLMTIGASRKKLLKSIKEAEERFGVEEGKHLRYEKATGEGPTFYSGAGFLDKAAKKLFEKLKRSPKPTPKPPEPFSSVKSKVKEIVFERRANLNLANYETNKFINSIEQKLNMTQREAMPFVIEGTDVPKELGRPDLQKVVSKDKELLKGVASEVKQHFNEGWKKIKAHIPDLSVKQIEEYVTHLWDVPRHKRAEAVSWFQTQNRFLERRFIDTYKEGIERGFRPKVLDISEIIRIHDAVSNRAIENSKYIKSLLKLKDQGIYLIQRTGTAPMEWIEVDYPALTRRIPLPKKQAGKKGEFVKELKVRVHPDLVRPLRAIFEQRFDHPVISAYEALNGILKKSMLSVSLFHHGALGETGVALIGPGKTAKIMFNPVRIYKALAKGEYDVFTKEPIARDSIEHGVQYGATADIPVSKIQGYLNDLAKATENKVMISRITKTLRDANSIWDKGLWNYLHDTLKLYGYETLVSKLDPSLGPEATKMAKREIAQLVNDTFGGQNWDTLMLTPKETQMLTWSLLSADWTLSTTRQALAPTGIGKIYNETADIRRKLGRRFWLRAALYFGIGINGLNVLFRNHDMKENPQYYKDKDLTLIDKTMFGNTVGKKTKLFIGRYKDGSERYLRWGKQFIDFYELVSSPIKKIGGKMAPIPQMLSEIFTGHSLSGFKNDDIYGKKGLEYTYGILKTVAKAPIPLALKRLMNENIEFKPTDIFMPSSKGMSRYRALEYFKKSIVDQDEDLLRETYEGALRNNLPAFTLFNGALSWTENEIMADVSKSVEDIKDAEMKLNVAASAYEKRRYSIILKRLHKEKADKEAGLRLLRTAIEKAKVYNELAGGSTPRLIRR